MRTGTVSCWTGTRPASGRGTRLREVLGGLLARAGREVHIEVNPEFVRPTDVSVGDSTRLREATGWMPTHDLDGLLDRLLDDWRERVRRGDDG